jgi:hypothetical protein
MKKLFSYITVLLLLAAITRSCTKTAAPVISPQIDQAFIQDIAVTDTAGKDVTLVKTFPKPVIDSTTGVETLGSAWANPINVTVKCKPGTNLSMVNVRFTMSGQSKFAKVSPVLGHLQDWTKGGQFTITSLSGKNQNVYAVQLTL